MISVQFLLHVSEGFLRQSFFSVHVSCNPDLVMTCITYSLSVPSVSVKILYEVASVVTWLKFSIYFCLPSLLVYCQCVHVYSVYLLPKIPDLFGLTLGLFSVKCSKATHLKVKKPS